MRRTVFALACVAFGMSDQASAHLVSTRFGELYSGVLHPLTTLQHLVPWLGLGLLSGLLGTNTARWVLLVFPASVGAGALAAGLLPELAFVTYLNLASFVVLGLLVALALDLSTPVFIGLTAIVGLSHGYANGTSELAGGALLLYVSGVALAAYVLVSITTGFAHTVARHAHWGSIAVRAAGSWIVATGLVFGGYSLMQAG